MWAMMIEEHIMYLMRNSREYTWLVCTKQFVRSNLQRMEEDLGINIVTTLENIIDMNSFHVMQVTLGLNHASCFTHFSLVHMCVVCAWQLYFVTIEICDLGVITK